MGPFSQITQPVLVVGLDSDLLYPLDEQRFLASAIPRGCFRVICSPEGHDGFLLEVEQIGCEIQDFLACPLGETSMRTGWAFGI